MPIYFSVQNGNNNSLKKIFNEVDFTLDGESSKIFMESLIQIFQQNGGKNFLTITCENHENKYSITIQNCNGSISVQEKLQQLEKENKVLKSQKAELQEDLSEAIAMIDSLTNSIQQLSDIDKKINVLQNMKTKIFLSNIFNPDDIEL